MYFIEYSFVDGLRDGSGKPVKRQRRKRQEYKRQDVRIQETSFKMNSRRSGVISVIMIFYGLNECFAVVTDSRTKVILKYRKATTPKMILYFNLTADRVDNELIVRIYHLILLENPAR